MENTENQNAELKVEGTQNIQQEEQSVKRQLEPVLIGAGGFAREIRAEVRLQYGNVLKIYVDDQYWVEGLFKISEFDSENQSALIAVGNPADKKALLAKLPENTEFWNYISPRAYVNNLRMGKGNFICAGTIITTNVTIGSHVHLNLNTTISHDAVLGSFVTTAPNVNISGNVTIKDGVYLDTASCVKENLTICEDVEIGANSSVVKDITESGKYVGIPAKKIK